MLGTVLGPEALIVNKTGVGIGTVLKITNAGSGDIIAVDSTGISRMVMSSLGYVGIGTTNPVTLLHLNKSSGQAIVNMTGSSGSLRR